MLAVFRARAVRRLAAPVIAAAWLALLLASCTAGGSGPAQGISEGDLARDFTLRSLEGPKASLSDYRGQVVLVNFWATWCPPCRAEIPAFQQVYEAYAAAGFVILGISEEESPDAIGAFAADMEVTYPVLLDPEGRVMRTYQAPGLPTSIVVDRDGIVRVRHVGSLTADKLEQYLAPLLGTP